MLIHNIFDYSVYIFDCDGVILDSNELKIIAMQKSLDQFMPGNPLIDDCIFYFKRNFGKSRFHHVEYFIKNIFKINNDYSEDLKQKILKSFSGKCIELYLKAEISPGFLDFISRLKGKKYIASGSEQKELNNIFYERNLDSYFDSILGSPMSKNQLIKKIIDEENTKDAIMFGDAIVDLNSALENDIDFIFISQFSNVKEDMIRQCHLYNFPIIENFSRIEV